MSQNKKFGKVIKYGAGTLLGLTLIYGTSKFNVANKVENFVHEGVSTVVDLTSIDAGEASNDYIAQLREEENPTKYEGNINNAIEESLNYVSDSSKAVFVEKTYDQLNDSLKQKLTQRSIDELNPSLSLIVLKETIKRGSYEMQKEIAGYSLNETLKNKKSQTEENVRGFFESIGDFLKNTYETVEKKVDEVF